MAQTILLKVINGVQSGAEVVLEQGDYSIGSGPEDDLQFTDASLTPSHARLRVGADLVEIRADMGAVLFAGGATLEAGDDRWAPVDPLAVIVVGTTRIAVAPSAANWSTITADPEFRRDVQPGASGAAAPGPLDDPSADATRILEPAWAARLPKGIRDGLDLASRAASRLTGGRPQLVLPSAVAGCLALVLLLGETGARDGVENAVRDPVADRAAVEKAVRSLSFPARIRVDQDVDGQIFVRGIIRDAAERRAVIQAVEASRVPFRPRLATAESILNEARNLIGADYGRVRAHLAEDGVLQIAGFLVDPEKASKLLDVVRTQINGPTQVDGSRLRTGQDIVADAVRVARDEGIGSNVVFTLVRNGFIEATGAIPPSQGNAWVSFLINYGDLFADKVPLRSLVQIVEPGSPPRSADPGGRPAVIGNLDPGVDGRVLDLKSLRLPRSEKGTAGGPSGIASSAANAAESARSGGEQTQPRATRPGAEADRPALQAAEKQLDRTGGGGPEVEARLRAYLVAGGNEERPLDVCAAEAPRDVQGLARALLILDGLSGEPGLSIASLDRITQLQVAEVMVSPSEVRDCLSRLSDKAVAERLLASVFLREVTANADFLNFLARDVAGRSLKLSGAQATRDGYVVDTSGRSYRRGASVDLYSRIRTIGELGTVIERADGIEILVYGQSLAWLVRARAGEANGRGRP